MNSVLLTLAIACSHGSFTTQELTPFEYIPRGLSQEVSGQVANSDCKVDGVYQESWAATCFLRSDLKSAKPGGKVSATYISGYEHGYLYATEVQTMNCTIE